eukprot:14378320-Alexandrium_andersonii.AAC.1
MATPLKARAQCTFGRVRGRGRTPQWKPAGGSSKPSPAALGACRPSGAICRRADPDWHPRVAGRP